MIPESGALGSQGYGCHECGFQLWHPLWTFAVSELGFYDDARFPGRCLLVLKEHFEHLDEVPPELAARFLAEAQLVGGALREAVDATRINYAVLGNTEPHVHFHIIPRAAGDPIPKRPPWEHPKPNLQLDAASSRRIKRQVVDSIRSREGGTS